MKCTKIAMLIALGAALAMGTATQAAEPGAWSMDPSVPAPKVHVAGATLLASFFENANSTNDWVDLDCDGKFGFDENTPPFVDQLAKSPYTADGSFFTVIYRGHGSGNGLADLVNWYPTDYRLGYACTDVACCVDPCWLSIDPCYFNSDFFTTGLDVGVINRASFAGLPPTRPHNVGIAVMDVPTTWFVKVGDAADSYFDNFPTNDGYGKNPCDSWDAGEGNELKSLSRADGLTPTWTLNTTEDDCYTVYDTNISWAPAAVIANPGTGLSQIKQSEAQFLFATGRLPSGENMAACTRDSGSGTRNLAMNSLCLDPSFGRGDNLGSKEHIRELYTDAYKVGEFHQHNNLNGSSVMGRAVKNVRLGVGYNGLKKYCEMSETDGKFFAAYNPMPLMFDLFGGSEYVAPGDPADGFHMRRPVCLNDDVNSGWFMGGAETMATVGDPLALSFGCSGDCGTLCIGSCCDLTGCDKVYPAWPGHENNPAMCDIWANLYIRNIIESLQEFNNEAGGIDPNDPCSGVLIGTPAFQLAQSYPPVAALSKVPLRESGVCNYDTNPNLNTSLQDYIINNNTVKVEPPFYFNQAGQIPQRREGDYQFITDTAGVYEYANGAKDNGPFLNDRNALAGDFNNDGSRDIYDICTMIAVYANPLMPSTGTGTASYSAAPNGLTGDWVCWDILGDFDGNGVFDIDDVRYFADGLAVDPATGKLDRCCGFCAIDTCYGGNFFGTTLATGAAYAAGDSRGDIASATASSKPGATPTADNVIDINDVEYLLECVRGGDTKEYPGQNSVGGTAAPSPAVASNWNDVNEAIYTDLSADLNCDFVIDCKDIEVLLKDILKTGFGDGVGTGTMDGVVSSTELNAIAANVGMGPGADYQDGDMNGDGHVSMIDVLIATTGDCVCPCCYGDLDQDGDVDLNDFVIFAQNWLTQL